MNLKKKRKFVRKIIFFTFIFQLNIFLTIIAPLQNFNLYYNRGYDNNNQNNNKIPNESPKTAIIREWEITWGEVVNDYSFDVTVDRNNNVYVVGRAYGWMCYLKKFNSSKEEEWTRTWISSFSFSDGWGVAVDNTTLDVYVVGYAGTFPTGPYNMTLIKYNSSGIEQWNRTWGGSYADYGYDVALDSEGNIYVTGKYHTTRIGGYPYDMILVKYNRTGHELWSRRWRGIYDEAYGHGIAIDSNDQIYITGSAIMDFLGTDYYYAFLVKYNSSGHYQWSRTYSGGSYHSEGWAVTVDKSDDIYFTGIGAMITSNDHIFLRKYDSEGNHIRTRTWNEAVGEKAFGIAVDSRNNVYLNSHIYNSTKSDWDAAMLRYSSSGDLNWTGLYDGNEQDSGYGVAVDSDDNVYFSGDTDINGDQEAYLLKYNQSLSSSSIIENPQILNSDGTSSNSKKKKKADTDILLTLIIILIISAISIISATSVYYYKNDKTLFISKKKERIEEYVKIYGQNKSKKLLDKSIDNSLPLMIFNREEDLTKIAQFLNNFNLTTLSIDFLEQVDKLDLEEKDKIEFIKEMLCFTQSERIEILNDMLEKSGS